MLYLIISLCTGTPGRGELSRGNGTQAQRGVDGEISTGGTQVNAHILLLPFVIQYRSPSGMQYTMLYACGMCASRRGARCRGCNNTLRRGITTTRNVTSGQGDSSVCLRATGIRPPTSFQTSPMCRRELTSRSPAIIRVPVPCDELRANADVLPILVHPAAVMRGLEGNTKLLAHIHIDPSATTTSDTQDGAEGPTIGASMRRMVVGGPCSLE